MAYATSRFFTWLGLSVAIAAPSFAQQPPDVVASDSNLNTAMGTGALSELNSSVAAGNTASGYGALHSDTIGELNVANGTGALYSNTIGSSNVAVGTNNLYYNTVGNDNTAVG